MCNAWNHPRGCNCGWGGGGRSSRNKGTLSSWGLLPNGHFTEENRKLASFTKSIASAETYPTTCRWCGASVYYHTNGYGDSVLFDSLGYPWQVHPCWTEYWNGKKNIRGEASLRTQRPPMILGQLLKVDDLKCLVMMGAILYLRKRKKPATETSVAEQLGILLLKFHEDYGHLYELYMRDRVIYLRLKDCASLGAALRSELGW